ncbi:MAG: cytochrome c oxidase subunit 3 [Candidatus Eiseniibacteriota bacterium]|jgi:cytochrome c oxidase subunit 3
MTATPDLLPARPRPTRTEPSLPGRDATGGDTADTAATAAGPPGAAAGGVVDVEEPRSPVVPRRSSGGGGGTRDGNRGFGGGGGGDNGRDGWHGRPGQPGLALLGIWVGLVSVAMLFAAFAAAYVARGSTGEGWSPIALPRVLWLNTFVLLASSLVLEWGRRRAARPDAVERLLREVTPGASRRPGGDAPRSRGARASRPAAIRPAASGDAVGAEAGPARGWLLATLILGLCFVLGQVTAWRQLVDANVRMSTSVPGAFFYMLSGTHAVHLAGGLVGLAFVTWWPARHARRLGRGPAVRVAATYWHAMGVLWVLLLILLHWRH